MLVWIPSLESWLALEGIQEQRLPGEHRSILILYLFHNKHLPCFLHELQVCLSPLLEAKVDNGVVGELKQIRQGCEE